MKFIHCCLLLGLSLSAQVQAGETLQDYRHSAALQLSGEGHWYRLELPFAAHLAAGHGDLRDLRVFDSNGQMQPYALIPGRSETVQQEQEHGVRWFPLRGRADAQEIPALRVERSTTGTLIELRGDAPAASGQQLRGWLLDASAIDAPLVRLNLDWNGAENGFQRFSIEASDDLQHWRSWGEGLVARLSFADERIDQRQVELPGQRARYLRLLWHNPPQAPHLQAVTLRSTDAVFRIAGEEFLLILPGADPREACERLQAICAQLAAREIASRGGDQRITLSAGLAHWPEQGQALDELLQVADAALYQAKRDGRNRVCDLLVEGNLSHPSRQAALRGDSG